MLENRYDNAYWEAVATGSVEPSQEAWKQLEEEQRQDTQEQAGAEQPR